MRKKLSIILLTGLAFSMIGCGATNEPAQSQTYAKKSLLPAKIPTNVDNTVFFPLKSSTVPASYNNLIKYNADYLVNNPNARVLLLGYTTENNDKSQDTQLGMFRVANVKQALLKNKVKSEQIEVKLSHEVHPDNKNNVITKNQRVDLIYINDAPSFYSFKNTPMVEMP